MSRRILVSLVTLSLVAAAAALGGLASAGASTVRYNHTWSPPLNLPSNYRPCCPSTAGFTTLPFSMNVTASQGFNLEVRMRTNWVDSKAVGAHAEHHPAGQSRQTRRDQDLDHSGPLAKDHHAQCRIEGSKGVIVNAQGPKSIDVADGNWHTILCVKSADSASGTNVRVYVDGLGGTAASHCAHRQHRQQRPGGSGRPGPNSEQGLHRRPVRARDLRRHLSPLAARETRLLGAHKIRQYVRASATPSQPVRVCQFGLHVSDAARS